jgi:hypothetical protein
MFEENEAQELPSVETAINEPRYRGVKGVKPASDRKRRKLRQGGASNGHNPRNSNKTAA